MLRGLTILVLCQFAGEVVARATHLPLPGPVVGLLILLAGLVATHGPADDLHATAGGLLRHLSLLFVPAGVGIVTQIDALRRDWAAILIAIPVSTVLGMAVTGLIMQHLSRRRR